MNDPIGEPFSTSTAANDGRLAAIDTLRGLAVLGILIMNIQAMAWVETAYINPTVLAPLGRSEWLLWGLGRLLADNRFIALFSMLFGIGILLRGRRQSTDQGRQNRLWLRRLFWLAVFGLLHGTLVWYGDILVTYAVCGLFVYWLRHLPATPLLLIAAVLLLAPTVTAWQLQTVIEYRSAADLEVLSALYWYADPVLAAAETAAYRGDYLQQMSPRLAGVGFMLGYLLPTVNFWKSSALMLIGMALFKLGIFREGQQRIRQRHLAVGGIGIGLLIAVIGLHQDFSHGWHIRHSLHLGRIYLYWSGIFMALGYVGLFMLWYRLPAFTTIKHRLAAVGRLALSNYLLQSLIGAFLFYGHGLAWFGQLRHAQLAGIVLAIWLVQMIGSPWWLRHFHQGPLEWLWRCLVAGRRLPFRRR